MEDVFVFVAHYLTLHSAPFAIPFCHVFSLVHIFFVAVGTYLICCARTKADAHETQCEDERVNKTLCAYLQANIT